MLRPDGHRDPAAVLGARPLDRGPRGAVEQGTAAVGGGPLRGGVEDLLEDPRHRQHERRLELAEPVDEVEHVAGVAQPHPSLDAADLDDPGEDVGQRAGRAAWRRPSLEQLVELLGGDAELEHEVAVGEHAALGSSGGARRVDQRGEVERCRCRTARLEGVVGDVAAEPGEHVDPVVVERPHVTQVLELAPDLGDAAHVGGPLGHHRAGARVAQHPPDLLGRRRLVDGHRHPAGEPDGVVDQRPLVAGAGDQRDPVAGLDARRRAAPWRPPGPRPGTRAAVTSFQA